jgi:5,10-methylenetetrahydromethanopterin reductase
MRIALGLDVDGSIEQTLAGAARIREAGFSSLWASQIFGPDTLTTLAIVGREYPDLDLGTAVVPVQPRHPTMLAAQARTVQGAIGGTLSLGIGLSHQVVVEGMWGLSFERPASYMKEYVSIIAPLLRGEQVAVTGERLSTLTMSPLGPRDVRTPQLLLAALGPVMLQIAGSLTDGTCLWMTGPKTIASHIAPTIRAAADAAGRPAPRIVAALPLTVTDDVAGARARINETYAIYPTLPSYRAMMDREGAAEAADVGVVGSRQQVLEWLHGLAEAGVTEFSAAPTGTAAERDATIEVLRAYQSA